MASSCCRLCLLNGSDLLPIRKLTVNSNGANGPPVTPALTQLIVSYLSIEPVIDSTMETNICSNCMNTISKWHWFRESCLQNDGVFQKMAQDPGKDDAVGQIDGYYEVEVKQEQELDICEEDSGEDFLTEQLDPSSERVLSKEKEVESTAKRKVRRPRISESERKLRRMQPCIRCGKVVKNMAHHLRLHNTIRRCFQCPHCPMSFYTNGNLKKHVNIHTKEKKYTCQVCERVFARIDNLKRHIKLMHLEKPPHQKSHNTKGNLKKHVNIHTKEKKYTCQVCERVFARVDNLKRHIKLMHLEKPSFQCPDCPEVYRYRVRLAKHQKSHKKAYTV